MRGLLGVGCLLVLLLVPGCGADRTPRPAGQDDRAAATDGGPAAEQSSILPRPFTAEQIRDEWVPGLTIRFRRTTPGEVTLERWTVLAADEDGVAIEFAGIDGAGNPVGRPEVRRAGWVELRDHASFPADRATREEATRETPLGLLDGWLYTVRDDEAGTLTEFFFARKFPGAPVLMRTTRGGDPVLELTQLERVRPE